MTKSRERLDEGCLVDAHGLGDVGREDSPTRHDAARLDWEVTQVCIHEKLVTSTKVGG